MATNAVGGAVDKYQSGYHPMDEKTRAMMLVQAKYIGAENALEAFAAEGYDPDQMIGILEGAGYTIDRAAIEQKIDRSPGLAASLLNDVQNTREETDALLKRGYYDIEGQIGGANTWANAMDSYALGEFRDDLEGAREIGSPDYVGNARTNTEALGAQRDALSRLRTLSDPSMTAQERFMMERARRQEERDRKAAMDAALRNLETRGMRSGGAEIAALTGAQRNTAETRMLQDLGAQANAVDRSMGALEGYGNLANTMRGQAADMSMFNKRMKADYDQWNANFRAQERDSRLGRSEKVYDARNEFTGNMYNRDRDRIDAKERGIKTRAVSNWQGSGATGDALKVMMGDEAARRGEKLLEDEDDGLLGLGIGPF